MNRERESGPIEPPRGAGREAAATFRTSCVRLPLLVSDSYIYPRRRQAEMRGMQSGRTFNKALSSRPSSSVLGNIPGDPALPPRGQRTRNV